MSEAREPTVYRVSSNRLLEGAHFDAGFPELTKILSVTVAPGS